MNVLLPASGFGKRNTGQGPVKELLIHQGHPLIEYSFQHLLEPGARDLVSKIIIVTRKEKLNAFENWLSRYRENMTVPVGFPPVVFHLHEPLSSQEWPLSLLATRDLWAQRNLVLLPDTHLMLSSSNKSKGLIETFYNGLSEKKSLWAVSKMAIEKVRTYGMVRPETNGLTLVEKPPNPDSPLVWGAFGFQRDQGSVLLDNFERSTQTHCSFRAPEPSGYFELEIFKDLSRE